MSHQELTTFIETKRADGVSDEEIRKLLVEKDWREDLIDAALRGEELPADEEVVTSEVSEVIEAPAPANEARGIVARTKGSWVVLAERFWMITISCLVSVGLLLVSGLIGAATYFVLNLSLGGGDLPMINPENISMQMLSQSLPLILAVLVGLLIAIPVIFFASALQLVIITSVATPTLKEALTRTWGTFASYAWVNVLATLVILGGLILLVIPGIVAAIGLAFVGIVYYLEDLRGSAALKRSWEVVKSNPMAVVGNLIILFAALITVSGIVNSVSAIAGSIVDNFVMSPLAVIYLVELYKDLVKQMK
jgi:hypothetical protein